MEGLVDLVLKYGKHKFTGLRQWGMHPDARYPCQVCGIVKGSHHLIEGEPCLGVVNIKGGHYQCELEHPHNGLGCCNTEAQAIWHTHEEVKHKLNQEKSNG